MSARATKTELEQLLAELVPLPRQMEALAAEVAAMRHDRQSDREALIRLEECVAGVKRALDKVNGALDNLAEAQRDIADTRARLDAVTKIVWALFVPVLLSIINSAIQAFAR